MTSMRIIRSDGRELTASDGWRGWLIADGGLDDWLDLDINITTAANVLTDGSRLVSKRVEECERTASILYVGPRDWAEVRDEALSFLSPKHTFKVYVTHAGRTRWAEGELSARSVPLEPEGRPCRATFSILCCDPYLRSEDAHEYAFGDSTPGLGWPFVSVSETFVPGVRCPVGFPASVLIYDGINTIHNAGDVTATYTVRIEADGDLVDPTITKDGTRFVKLVTTLKAGDVAEIDFTKSPPRVEVNGENAIQKCSRDSSFVGMEMAVGANTFTFSVSNEENRSLAKVQILYNDRYMGV